MKIERGTKVLVDTNVQQVAEYDAMQQVNTWS